jgi:hypothetical protein
MKIKTVNNEQTNDKQTNKQTNRNETKQASLRSQDTFDSALQHNLRAAAVGRRQQVVVGEKERLARDVLLAVDARQDAHVELQARQHAQHARVHGIGIACTREHVAKKFHHQRDIK